MFSIIIPTLNNINLPITGHADLVEDKRQISFDFDFIDNTTENIDRLNKFLI